LITSGDAESSAVFGAPILSATTNTEAIIKDPVYEAAGGGTV